MTVDTIYSFLTPCIHEITPIVCPLNRTETMRKYDVGEHDHHAFEDPMVTVGPTESKSFWALLFDMCGCLERSLRSVSSP